MLQKIEFIFEDMELMLKELKKAKYEENMKDFCERNNEIIFNMVEQLKDEKREVVAQQIADSFIAAIKKKFGKKGKIKGYLQWDLNFFMIYYVFPAILMTQSEGAELMADTLCETWGKSFKNSKIGYTDYDTILNSFKEKIFGIISI